MQCSSRLFQNLLIEMLVGGDHALGVEVVECALTRIVATSPAFLWRGGDRLPDRIGNRCGVGGIDWPAAVGVASAIVYHQWHPTRAPGAWADNAGAPRFLKGTPTVAARGLENPIEQPPCVVEHFDAAGGDS